MKNIFLSLSLCASICVAGCTRQARDYAVVGSLSECNNGILQTNGLHSWSGYKTTESLKGPQYHDQSELLYRHRYYWDNYSIVVSDWMQEHSWSLGYCVIEISDGKNFLIEFPIDGRLKNSWVTDLDDDGHCEVIVFTKCVGSGGFGEAFVYEWDEIELEERKLPSLSSEQEQGYMGHDIFKVEDNCLIREFPIYRKGDANCCPKGGERQIIYWFKDNVWKSETNSCNDQIA